MKHYKEMTPEAFAYRANAFRDCDTVAIILGKGDDHRSVTLYFEYANLDHSGDGSAFDGRSDARLIGVTLGEDDPHFKPEVLDRDGAWEMFGQKFVEGEEEREWERAIQ